ncbi:PaaX family transcriptional regulator C-terminal domain-containing protein [Jannaschia seohaensis]|uniref:Phenylacetic acid degradation operon negative regulatory protein n=1 Tax=Jannaschia seohaensis TaxID=475081 RepID=A0A2Y9A2U9_9RHOB|nr:PaaX family transcriptional regulator C-terminal domain-containing protein [Jannaschia seohaensis]PWJ21928.1 phenylacetic acid degradation operon negative regulatory protein [Jannaschia seohaensis]SSA38206.1 phenylacetic acid degradation operon negative regulatory protein [Jannaschia seohaensis]
MTAPHPHVLILTDGTPPRTWSVIVTIFGDLARAEGQEIDSATLARLCEAMGLRPEALRTALHRLHKEGWLERRRAGRHSVYRLSAQGRAESEAAQPRIYGPQPVTRAYVVLGPDAEGHAVAPGIRVAASPVEGPETLTYPLDRAPDWLRSALLPPETVALIGATRARFDRLAQALEADLPQDALTRAVLRVLCVHAWRRIALRLPDLPDLILPAGADLARTRARFADLREALPAPSLEAL